MVDLWYVITTHNRHDMLHDLLGDVNPERTVIVDHRCDPPIQRPEVHHVIRCDCEPNISHLWNLGLEWVASYASKNGEWMVAVLNDDLRIPEGHLEYIADLTYRAGRDIGYPDMSGQLKRGDVSSRQGEAGPHDLATRMTGYAFILRGSSGLRADEQFVWWYGDDDLEWRAIEGNGTLRVGGAEVQHLTPNASLADPALVEQTARDREAFARKWGQTPW